MVCIFLKLKFLLMKIVVYNVRYASMLHIFPLNLEEGKSNDLIGTLKRSPLS
ncbi:hypothetical protein NIES4074_65920 [Cylindrospermum sp. NIES-4074]|nr:hypothetical protein NIES4074_65920 [Cylindrospermum sp. NIES-4074]